MIVRSFTIRTTRLWNSADFANLNIEAAPVERGLNVEFPSIATEFKNWS